MKTAGFQIGKQEENIENKSMEQPLQMVSVELIKIQFEDEDQIKSMTCIS